MWQWLKGVLTGTWIRGQVERDPSYNLAVNFSDNFKPGDGRDYKWALDYSVKEYEQASLRGDALDDKADTLIGYLGAGSTFIRKVGVFLFCFGDYLDSVVFNSLVLYSLAMVFLFWAV